MNIIEVLEQEVVGSITPYHCFLYRCEEEELYLHATRPEPCMVAVCVVKSCFYDTITLSSGMSKYRKEFTKSLAKMLNCSESTGIRGAPEALVVGHELVTT